MSKQPTRPQPKPNQPKPNEPRNVPLRKDKPNTEKGVGRPPTRK